jgi:hypothetical protein
MSGPDQQGWFQRLRANVAMFCKGFVIGAEVGAKAAWQRIRSQH